MPFPPPAIGDRVMVLYDAAGMIVEAHIFYGSGAGPTAPDPYRAGIFPRPVVSGDPVSDDDIKADYMVVSGALVLKP